MQPRIYELDNINVDIRENHLRAWRDEQARILRSAQTAARPSLIERVEVGLGCLLVKAGESLRSCPVPFSPARLAETVPE